MSNNWDINKSPGVKRLRKNKSDFLKELLCQCTEKQKLLFNRMYGSVDTVPEEKIEWAIVQCENTIKENQEGIKNDKTISDTH